MGELKLENFGAPTKEEMELANTKAKLKKGMEVINQETTGNRGNIIDAKTGLVEKEKTPEEAQEAYINSDRNNE